MIDIKDILLRTKLFIAEERSSLFDSHVHPKTGAITEPDVQDDLQEMADMCSELEQVGVAFDQLRTAKAHAVLQAQTWAQEARTQKAIVKKIYDAIDFEGGDWNGARPVVEKLAELKKLDASYPSDMFWLLISKNSPYAFYLFQWVPYQTDAKRWRLKMLHDVKTFDGREAHGIWPNGGSCGPFKDEEVEFIRISKKQHGAEWQDPREPSPTVDEALDAAGFNPFKPLCEPLGDSES